MLKKHQKWKAQEVQICIFFFLNQHFENMSRQSNQQFFFLTGLNRKCVHSAACSPQNSTHPLMGWPAGGGTACESDRAERRAAPVRPARESCPAKAVRETAEQFRVSSPSSLLVSFNCYYASKAASNLRNSL